MIWFLLACAAFAGIGGGLFLGLRLAKSLMLPNFREQGRIVADARNVALCLLRRELANWMLRRDPERYRRAYKEAHRTSVEVSAANRAEQGRQLAELAERYPSYTDFDLISTREYVLYSDALSVSSFDEIERHYTDIIRFQALQAAINEDWPSTSATSDKELEHLDDYLRRFQDTLLKRRMEAALYEFHAYWRAKGDGLGGGAYETDLLAVRHIAHFAETRYGVHFKDTNEFGLYGIFYSDDGDKPFESFYRSNAGFSAETYLDDMHISGPL